MARRKGFFGTLGSLFRWAIFGLAALFAVALYINFTQEPDVTVGEGELVIEVPEADEPEAGAAEAVVEAVEEAVETVEDVATGADLADDMSGSTDAGEATQTAEVSEDAAGAIPETSDVVEVIPETDVIRIPGDDAAYSLLNAWRRDDGAIEITTERTLGDDVSTTIRLVRCAPLELGLIAEGDGPRNDDPEMERALLGTAEAWMAAQACGAVR